MKQLKQFELYLNLLLIFGFVITYLDLLSLTLSSGIAI
jgi:hypothetical protein